MEVIITIVSSKGLLLGKAAHGRIHARRDWPSDQRDRQPSLPSQLPREGPDDGIPIPQSVWNHRRSVVAPDGQTQRGRGSVLCPGGGTGLLCQRFLLCLRRYLPGAFFIFKTIFCLLTWRLIAVFALGA